MSLKDILCDTEFPYERDSDDDKTIFLNYRFLGMQKILTSKNREIIQNAGRESCSERGWAKDCSQYLSTRGRNVAKETKT